MRVSLTASTFAPDEQVLLFFAAPPRLVESIAGRVAQVVVHEVDFTARERLRAVSGETATLRIAEAVFPEDADRFDQAVIVSPKGRGFARALLWSAYRSLKPGGTVYMIGGNAEGIKSVVKDSAQFFGHSPHPRHQAAPASGRRDEDT